MATPYSLIPVDVTGSTQEDARRAFAGSPVLVVAGSQTAGRGRGGARWDNAPRAMAASLCLSLPWPSKRQSLVALLAGLAAARVLDCSLKWPNDVVDGDDKLGGILVEASEAMVTVGFGLNVWWPDPPEGVTGWRAADPGPGLRIEVAEEWAQELLGLIAAGPENWPQAEYTSRCATLGREIEWSEGGAGERRRGRATTVDQQGRLVVETAGGNLTLHSGAVRHVRPGRRT